MYAIEKDAHAWYNLEKYRGKVWLKAMEEQKDLRFCFNHMMREMIGPQGIAEREIEAIADEIGRAARRRTGSGPGGSTSQDCGVGN